MKEVLRQLISLIKKDQKLKRITLKNVILIVVLTLPLLPDVIHNVAP